MGGEGRGGEDLPRLEITSGYALGLVLSRVASVCPTHQRRRRPESDGQCNLLVE